jgi:hypothetical protein
MRPPRAGARAPIISAIMRSRFEFVTTVVGYLLFASSIIVVASFSTTGRNLRHQNDDLVSANGGFGTIRQRSCDHVSSSAKFLGSYLSSNDFCGSSNGRDKAAVVENMVVEGTSVDFIYGDSDTEQNSSNGDTLQQQLQSSIWKGLSDWFQGDFDNYAQVVEDRKQKLEPREGGGHEHFHCTLVPVTESTRLAAFFFDGNPDRIFRFRYYEMIPPAANGEAVEMMLNTLHPDLEKLLKSQASNPLSWPYMFENFQPADEKESKVNRLTKCEITWSFESDPIQHSYLTDIPEDDENDSSKSLHAVMVHGPTVVNSTVIPGMQIRIVDQLSLFQNTFYINDRGFDPITGSFIYGNQREVPYRLERVSSISSNSTSTITPPSSSKDGGLRRIITNSDLEWTMGPDFRSTEKYKRKLELIGGPSVGMNKRSFKSGDTSK